MDALELQDRLDPLDLLVHLGPPEHLELQDRLVVLEQQA